MRVVKSLIRSRLYGLHMINISLVQLNLSSTGQGGQGFQLP